MKVITSIYLNCRPDLRDEWLTGNEVDDVSDAQVLPLSLPLPSWLTLEHRHRSKLSAIWSSFVSHPSYMAVPGNSEHSN